MVVLREEMRQSLGFEMHSTKKMAFYSFLFLALGKNRQLKFRSPRATGIWINTVPPTRANLCHQNHDGFYVRIMQKKKKRRRWLWGMVIICFILWKSHLKKENLTPDLTIVATDTFWGQQKTLSSHSNIS